MLNNQTVSPRVGYISADPERTSQVCTHLPYLGFGSNMIQVRSGRLSRVISVRNMPTEIHIISSFCGNAI